MTDLDTKLRDLDEYRLAAVHFLIDWLREDMHPLASMARGRHVEGSYRYGDKLMYEYTQNELKAEAAQELADAVNYIALLLSRDARPGSSVE